MSAEERRDLLVFRETELHEVVAELPPVGPLFTADKSTELKISEEQRITAAQLNEALEHQRSDVMIEIRHDKQPRLFYGPSTNPW